MKNLFLLLLAGALLFSCKAKKAMENEDSKDSIAISNPPKDANKPINTPIEFYQKVLPPVKFDQIKISSKLNIETNATYLPTLDATTYIVNDEKIWMNLQAFFLNMARGIATNEGIKAYVRTEKTYIDSDFEYLNNLLNTNFINFDALEKLLMGRTFIKINSNDFLLNKNAQGYRMVSVVNQRMEVDSITREYKVEMDYANNFDLKRIFLEDVNSLDQLEVSYAGWEAFETFRMPKNVKIVIKGNKNGQILLENTKFESVKMNTPFSIPGNYKKIEIK